MAKLIAPKKVTAQPEEKVVKGKSKNKETKVEAFKQEDVREESLKILSEAESKFMTKAEEEALQPGAEDIVDNKTKVSTEKMEKAVELVQDIFNLSDKGYVVNSFSDAGTKIKLSLVNTDFELTISIKDAENHGLL
jgi:phage repressor protein C with HTH and peptisase S24 domain